MYSEKSLTKKKLCNFNFRQNIFEQWIIDSKLMQNLGKSRVVYCKKNISG